MSTKYFSFCINEKTIKIRYKGMPKDEVVFNAVLPLIIAFPMIILSIISFVHKGFFYAIMFIAVAILLIFVTIFGIIDDKKRERALKYIIDKSGIAHNDVKASYHIEWNGVNSWGFIDNNIISGIRRTRNSPKQICLYFSKRVYDEQFLRKKFDCIENKHSPHYSSNDMIVLGFKENEIDKSILDSITTFVNKRIASSKNQNYLKESNSQ